MLLLDEILHSIIDFLPTPNFLHFAAVCKHWYQILLQNPSFQVGDFLYQTYILQPFNFYKSFPSHAFILNQLQTRYADKNYHSITMSLKRLENTYQHLSSEEKLQFATQMEYIKPFLRHCFWSIDAMLFTELPIVKEQVQFYKLVENFLHYHPQGHIRFASFLKTLFVNFGSFLIPCSVSVNSFETMLQQVNFFLFGSNSKFTSRKVSWKIEDEQIAIAMAYSPGTAMNIIDCKFYSHFSVALQMVKFTPAFVDESLWKNEQFVLQAIPLLSPLHWHWISKKLMHNVSISRQFITTKKISSFKTLQKIIQCCPSIVEEAVMLLSCCGLLLYFIPVSQWTREMILTAVKQNGKAIRFVAKYSIWFDDLELNLEALQQTFYCLPFVNHKIITQTHLLQIAAVHPCAEKHVRVTKEKKYKLPFIGNKSFVMSFVQINPLLAVYFLNNDLIVDESVAVAFAKRKPKLLSHFAIEIRNLPSVQLALLQSKNAQALNYLIPPKRFAELTSQWKTYLYKLPNFLITMNIELEDSIACQEFIKTILQIDGSLYYPLQQRYPTFFCKNDISLLVWSLEHVNCRLASTELLFQFRNEIKVCKIFAKHDLSFLKYIFGYDKSVDEYILWLHEVSPYSYFPGKIQNNSIIKEELQSLQQSSSLPWTDLLATKPTKKVF